MVAVVADRITAGIGMPDGGSIAAAITKRDRNNRPAKYIEPVQTEFRL